MYKIALKIIKIDIKFVNKLELTKKAEKNRKMDKIVALKGKKILIIGCCGSGKSYFARELAKLTGLPLYHLDKIRWRKDWSLMPHEEFIPLLREIMTGDEWIVDGNYISTMEMRLARAEVVFYFDLPTDECLANIDVRKGKPRPDMPDGMTDRDDPEFIEFIKNFKRDTAPKVEELLANFDGEVIVFKSREDKYKYLNG